jgi:hypothetical protein
MSENFQYKAGISNVGSYQVSGIPWATSSLTAPSTSSAPLQVSFPSITKFIVVKNVATGSVKVRVGFSANGVKGSNYFLLDKDESFQGDIKVSSIYLLSNNGTQVPVSIVAGLTGIDSGQLYNNWSGSAGVG